MAIREEVIEALAELEHEQWEEWSKHIARVLKEILGLFSTNYMSNLPRIEQIMRGQIRSWEQSWIPYAELSEENKGLDRVWAEKTLKAVEEKLNFQWPEEAEEEAK